MKKIMVKRNLALLLVMALMISMILPTNALAKMNTKAANVTVISSKSSTLSLKVGETYTIKTKILPSTVSNKKLTYSSSDKEVVKVTSSGKLTAVSKGSATITIKAVNGKAVCRLTVVVKANKSKKQKSKVTPTAAPTAIPTATPTPTAVPTATPTPTAAVTPTAAPTPIPGQNWIATWSSAQQCLDPGRSEYPPTPGLKNNTFRQTIRISKGGSQIRFTFSNEYGTTPLVLNSVHIAKPTGTGDSAIDTATDTKVTFNGGSESVSIPAGKSMTSDLISYDAKDLDRITVSTCFGDVPTKVTSHTGGRTTAFLIAGNHVSDASVKTGSKTNEQWYFLTSIDIMAPSDSKAIACLGDSTTDGRGVTTNMDNRWTDILANRLIANPTTKDVTVLNEGIGANSIFGGLGPAAYLRFKRDVLDQLGVKYAIVFEGVNDIGYASDLSVADRIIEKYKSFAEQAHAKGIKIYGATITPFKGNSYYTALHEKIRQKLNDFIRNGNCFDGCIDFDKAIRDTADPEKIASQYYTGVNSGDGLHPNAAGYKALGECIDLTLFEK